MKTLIWTPGELMPLDLLWERLRCPKCGNRKIHVYFEVPNIPKAMRRAHYRCKTTRPPIEAARKDHVWPPQPITLFKLSIRAEADS